MQDGDFRWATSPRQRPSFNDTSWAVLDLPHDWSIEGALTPPPEGDKDGGYFPHGIGWYRKSFTLPASAAGKKLVVEFDGIYMNSDVWIKRPFPWPQALWIRRIPLRPDGIPDG